MSSVMNSYATKEVNAQSYEEQSAASALPRASTYEWIKLLADFTIALTVFLLSMPVLIIGAVLVRSTSRGPAIYSQDRLGRGGRPFLIYKLRTMYHKCEAETGPQWCAKGDPRVTPVGRFLRTTH